MPHCKCEACKIRLEISGERDDVIGDLCPGCGSLLEPVTELAELVGFRSIKSLDAAPDAVHSEPHRRIADRVDEFVLRRTAILERDRHDAERWLDDSDDPHAAAVVLPPPPTYL